MRVLNKFFAYAFFVVGTCMIILLMLVVTQFTSNLNAVNSDAELDATNYGIFSSTIGWCQLLLALGSFLMIILNIKNNPKAIIGYLLSYVGFILEIILPSLFVMLMFPTVAGIYMKAGSIINKSISGDAYGYRKTYRKKSKSVDWFYEER